MFIYIINSILYILGFVFLFMLFILVLIVGLIVFADHIFPNEIMKADICLRKKNKG